MMMMISLISWKHALLHTGLFVCLLSVIRLSVRHIALTNHNVCVNNKLVTQYGQKETPITANPHTGAIERNSAGSRRHIDRRFTTVVP
jgi:hypothetical protein